MNLNDVLGELADLLERHPTMPFAQYVVKLPDRGGMYHLTVTGPGRASPQETVVALQAECAKLKGQVTALEPLAGNVAALTDAVAVLRNHVVDETAATTAAITKGMTDLKEQVVEKTNAAALVIHQGMADLSERVGDQTTATTDAIDTVNGVAQAIESHATDARNLATVVEGVAAKLPDAVAERVTLTTEPVAAQARDSAAAVRTSTKHVSKVLAAALTEVEEARKDVALKSDLMLSQVHEVRAFVDAANTLLGQVRKGQVDLPSAIQGAVAGEFTQTVQPPLQEILTDVQAALDEAVAVIVDMHREAAALGNGLSGYAATTVEVVKELATATHSQVTSTQQDVLRHVTGATAAMRESTGALQQQLDEVQVVVLKHLTDDVAGATAAMQKTADALPGLVSEQLRTTQLDLMTAKVHDLEHQVGLQGRVLDAAERLVHAVGDTSPDLLSPEVRALVTAFKGL